MSTAEEPRGTKSGLPPPPGPTQAGADLLGALREIERSLGEIRGQLESAARARQHGDFSLARLAGALLQILAAALVIVAVADWAFDAPAVNQLLKLAFASVLQLGALTAFVLARDAR